MSFTHLAVRSEYSIVDSIVRIKGLIEQAVADQQTTLGIADMSNMFAVVKFYKQCLEKKIKPIIGTEMVIGDDADNKAVENAHSVILYAMNNDGYKRLLSIVSKGYTHSLIDAVPVITKQDLFANNDGIIAILTERSELGMLLKSKFPERASPLLAEWYEAFGDRLYIGIKRTKRTDEDKFIENAIIQSQALQIPLVAFNDVRFLHKDDFEAHEARVCITSGYTLSDENRPMPYCEEQYFKTQDEMVAIFSDIPTVIDNTNALAERCNVTLTLGVNVLPEFPIPDGETIESFFKKLSYEGLYRRLDKLYPQEGRGDDWADKQKQYEDRLEFELNTIIQMGFPGYFLIVMDFIRWAKDNGVPVGPGRGSGAGSLVAYSLNITDLDPLAYDLLFERFLNPERVSMPDFDIDFCIEGRDRVIDYVARKYGRDAVSQIITFGTMAAKAVIRDVTRVQGKPFMLGEKISKMIPKTPGISLEEALKEEALLRDLITNPDTPDHEVAKEIWDMALKLEGITRNVGKHAGGVLIAPNKISDFSPVYCDDEGHRTSQYDKDDVEAVGLVKFDFLGLRNLTVIKSALDNINHTRASRGEPPIDPDLIPLDDEPTYQEILQVGKTSAVFQLESNGMKKYLKMLKPTNIEDVIAMCALYRPGPLESGMVTDFIDRKHGVQAVAYPDKNFQHQSLETPLKNTYGVIVYQEQVMQIAQVLSGYSLGGADMLRRAMGKKKPEEMAKQRQGFVDGAIANQVDGELAGKIFDLVEKFAGYGFNKSHSAAYGVLAYQTAFLKHYYPAEFLAAVLTSEMRNIDAVVFAIGDCKDNFGLEVLPPSVNHSQWHFVVKDAKTIIYGLGAVKGVGEDAVASIVNARKDGEFKDLYDFCNRVDIKKVGKRTLEALIKGGCFDDMAKKLRPTASDPHEIRGGLWEQLPSAMQVANKNLENKLSGTFDLFAEVDDGLTVAPPLPNVIWRTKDRLKFEYEVLGLYLTGHPIDEYKDELQHYVQVPRLAELNDTKNAHWTSALVVDVANFGNRVAITLDDGSARLEVSCFVDKFRQLKDVFKLGEIALLKIAVQESKEKDRQFYRIVHATSVLDARLRHIKALNIKIERDDLTTLQNILPFLKENNPPPPSDPRTRLDNRQGDDEVSFNDGCVPIALFLHDDFGIAKVLVDENRFRMHPSDNNLTDLKRLLTHNLKISY